MNRHHDLDSALRFLDAAEDHIDPRATRAQHDLSRILAVDPSGSVRDSRATRRPRARTTRRLVLAGAAVATIAAGLLALPPLTGGDEAFATWTAIPVDITAQPRADAAAQCRERYEDNPPDPSHPQALREAEVAIAEQRGVWVTVVLTGADGFSAMCITDDSAGLFTGGMIGSIGTPADYTPSAPQDVIATDLGSGTVNNADISLAAGIAGPDIVDIAYPSPTHGDVAATVSHGRFALWLPGDELEDASSAGVEVEVTYRDGTTGTARLTL